VTDRDNFAAAALTGLLAAPTDKDRSWDYWARLSYEAADAMLREQGDAEPMPKQKRAEVPQQKPVAWAVAPRVEDEIDCEFVYSDQQDAAAVASGAGGVVAPLYRQPQPMLTDAEREAIHQAIDEMSGQAPAAAWTVATLRGLLERLK
jgi:hypothetical protein